MSEEKMETAAAQTGWKPIPLALKILFVVLILWVAGSVMNLPNLYENGAPLFGKMVSGTTVALMVAFFDIIGPLVFLIALWTRKTWAAKWAYTYIGLFILSSAIALINARDEFGLHQILLPMIVSGIFLVVIFCNRNYFDTKQ